MIPRLKTTYSKEIVGKLTTKLSLKNKHEVPKIEKIVLNMGLGEDKNQSLQNLKNLYLILKLEKDLMPELKSL